jgi:hypothetical protein
MADGTLCPSPPADSAGMALISERPQAFVLGEGLEAEELVKAWIDPVILALISLLFSPSPSGEVKGFTVQTNGLEFFARLCAEAIQPSLFPASMIEQTATISIQQGVVGLCNLPGWKWKRETTLKLLQLFEVLTILYRRRRRGATVIEIPLGKRARLPTKEELLNNLDTCKKRNKKTRRLIVRVKARLERYGIPSYEEANALLGIDRIALDDLHHKLLARLQAEQLSPVLCARIMLSFDQDAVPIIAAHRQAVLEAVVESSTEYERRVQETGSAQDPNPEDKSIVIEAGAMYTSFRGGTDDEEEEDTGASQANQKEEKGTLKDKRRSRCRQKEELSHEDDQRRPERTHIPATSHNMSTDNIAQHVYPEFRTLIINRKLIYNSEEELQKEAENYSLLIDGDIKGKKRKGAIEGYKNRIKEDPLRASVCLVNTLLRKHCPLLGENLLRNPRQWFHSSYKMYADKADPLQIENDIRSWVESSYSYEQIAQALIQWQELHSEDVWKRRPFVADAEAEGLLASPADAPREDGQETSSQGEADALLSPVYPPGDMPWTEEACVALFSYYAGCCFPQDVLDQLRLAAGELVSVHTRYRVEASLQYLLEAEPSGAYVEVNDDGFLSLSLPQLRALLVDPGGLIALVDCVLPDAYQYLLECLETGDNRFLLGQEVEIEGEMIAPEAYLKLCWKAYTVYWAETYGQGMPIIQREEVDQRLAWEAAPCVKDSHATEVGRTCEQEETMHILTALSWGRALKALAEPAGYLVEVWARPDTWQGFISMESASDPRDRRMYSSVAEVRGALTALGSHEEEQQDECAQALAPSGVEEGLQGMNLSKEEAAGEQTGDNERLQEVGVKEGDMPVGEEEEGMHVLTAIQWMRALKALAEPAGYRVELQTQLTTWQGFVYVESRTDPDDSCICTSAAQVQTLLEALEREREERRQSDDQPGGIVLSGGAVCEEQQAEEVQEGEMATPLPGQAALLCYEEGYARSP